MKRPDSLLIFMLENQRYALPLPAVERVVRMVAITPLPKAPEIILGAVNIQGQVIPVINMRRRFGMQERKIALSDQLVVAHTARRPVALVADAVLEVMACPEQSLIAAENITPGIEYVEGVIKLEDGLILIHDLEKFLSLEEEKLLAHALKSKALETS